MPGTGRARRPRSQPSLDRTPSGLFKAYHWPGFASGADYDERHLLALMRDRAFAIQGRTAPPLETPEAPRLLPIEDASRISWQGSVGASAYVVERSVKEGGPWTVVADDVSDAAVPYEPLFHDASAAVGESHHYRVQVIAEETDDPVVILGSPDGRTFGPLPARRESFAFGDADYGYWLPILYSGEGRENDRYLKSSAPRPSSRAWRSTTFPEAW